MTNPNVKANEQQTVPDHVMKPKLHIPLHHDFSVFNIELGDSKEKIERQIGPAKRSSYNEYGVKWYAYHENYHNFFMIAYDKAEKVAGLFTNQDLFTSKQGLKWGSLKEDTLKQMGAPLTKIQKGSDLYLLQNGKEYNLFQNNHSFITIFYDYHHHDKITAVQIISEKLEKNKKSMYTKNDAKLKQGFELQLFDLTNASRVQNGLAPLIWDDLVQETASGHSLDMAQNDYFEHTNLEGQSPFDRMKNDNIFFKAAGENIAYGQLSSIFAHESFMNSISHRENILKSDFESLGVGVAFDAEFKPYFTENFLKK